MKAERKPGCPAPTEPGDAARPGLAARQAAVRLLAAVVDAHTSLDGLVDAEHGHPQFRALSGPDRALVRAILASALRFRGEIERRITSRLRDGLPPNAHALRHILHVGAAQILILDVPDSAAVDLAVANAKLDPRTRRFSGLVNAVLRGIAREKADAPLASGATNAAPWFADALCDAYGVEKAESILRAHGTEPPTDFTVKADPAGWAARWGGVVTPTGSVRLARLPAPVAEMEGFADGEWWVQDAAAALPARLLHPAPGMCIADLCAAPGGKTAQLAFAGAEVTAFDLAPSRLRRLRTNLSRLRLEAQTVEADLLRCELPAEPFDAVLLDAPCSSTGTVRRHPDVPWTKGPDDVEKLARLQRRLLDRAVRFVRPGGQLVFSNCSLLPAEGEELWRAFLAETPEAEPDPIRADEVPGIAGFVSAEGTLRTTPADWPDDTPALGGLDGFFAARLRRRN